MEEDRPSLTAHRVAVRRAAHQILDHPKVLEDPIALKIVGEQSISEIRSQQPESVTSRHLRAFVVARSRYTEDALAEAIKRGLSQYVILGAGLDTFAYRSPYPPSSLQIFEVDHPSTQRWKRNRLQEAQISIPESLTFVDVDFETQTLAERLEELGFKIDVPAFFAFLGVSMYLTREAVMTTINYVATSTSPGSEIVFDYTVPPDSLAPLQQASFHALARRVAAAGEPWRTFLDPQLLVNELIAMGFTHTEDLGPEDINSRFFKDRTDGLRVGGLAHLIKASR
jgi:methyltransferase (TIGR00027 family)